MTLARLLTILRARAHLIGTAMLVVLTAAFLVTLVMPDRYVAYARVLVDHASGEAAAARQGNSSIANVVSTHRDLIMSQAVALNVVDRLKLAGDPAGTQRLLNGYSPLADAWRRLLALLQTHDEEDNSIRNWLSERLLHALSVNSKRDSQLLSIEFTAADAEFSARAANAFVAAYAHALARVRSTPAREESEGYDKEIGGLRRDLNQAQTKLAEYQQKHGITSTEERLDIESTRMNDLSNQIAVAEGDAYSGAARRDLLKAYLNSRKAGTEPPDEVANSPGVLRVQDELGQSRSKLDELSHRVGPNHPEYIAAKNEEARLRRELDDQRRTAARGLLAATQVPERRAASLRTALDQQKARVLQLKGSREQMTVLAREVESAQHAYDTALQHLMQTRLETEAGRPSMTVVDQATVPLRRSSPNMRMNLALGAAGGLLLGIGLALLLESLTRRVYCAEDLLEAFEAPLLAVLPPRLPQGGGRRLLGANVYMLTNR